MIGIHSKLMKNILFIVLALANLNLLASTEEETHNTGIPLISIIVIVLAALFLLVKGKFKSSFRANKTAVIIALLTLALLAWPFKFFEIGEQTTNTTEQTK